MWIMIEQVEDFSGDYNEHPDTIKVEEFLD
jgi:hypothetical protein